MPIDKTKLQGLTPVYPLHIPQYKDFIGQEENQTHIEKINSVIQSLHAIGKLTNKTVAQWNSVMKWVLDEGLEEITTQVTNEKLDVALNTGLKKLTETVASDKIDDLLASGQLETIVEESLVEINHVVEEKLEGFTEQLADKAGRKEVRLKSNPIGLDDAGEDLLGAIQEGEGAIFNLQGVPRKRSVTPESTVFFDTSVNLFDKDTVILGKGIDTATGAIVDNPSNFLQMIPAGENETYTGDGIYYRLAFFTTGGEFISTELAAVDGAYTWTTPPRTDYYLVSAGKGQLSRMMINEGDTLQPYKPYYSNVAERHLTNIARRINGELTLNIPITKKSLKKGIVEPEATSFFKTSSNLFNKEKVVLGKTINSTTGAIVDSATNFVSEPEYLNPSATYTYKAPNARYAIYRENNTLVQTAASDSAGVLSFTMPNEISYVRFAANVNRLPAFQLNEGDTIQKFEERYVELDEKYLPKSDNEKEVVSYALAPNMPSGEIEPTDTIEALDGTGTSGYVNLDLTVEKVYAWYDGLMATHNLVKKQIGMDASGQHPINVYISKPENIMETPNVFNYKSLPKIILGSGMHGRDNSGDPNNAVYSLYWFFKDILERNGENEKFDYLKNNVEIHIIPLQNPWAVQNATRKNSNGVDINRNFDTETWRSGEPASSSYGGPSPFSEPESRALRDYILENTDAVLVMDFHTVGTLYEHNKWIYFEMPTGNDLYYVANYHVKRMSTIWKQRNYPLDDSKYYGYVFNTLAGKYQEWVNEKMGIPAAVMEGAPHIPNTDEPRDSYTVMEMYYDSMVNWVLHYLQYLRDKR